MNGVATFFRESSVGRFFIPLGIFLIVFSIFAFISIDKSKNYIKTNAVVSRTQLYEEEYFDGEDHHDATYEIFVKYTVDGVNYDEELGIFSGYKVGDKVTISYNPSNPKEIAQPSTIVLPIVLLVVGICALVGGIISIVNAVKKHKAMKLQEDEWSNGK